MHANVTHRLQLVCKRSCNSARICRSLRPSAKPIAIDKLQKMAEILLVQRLRRRRNALLKITRRTPKDKSNPFDERALQFVDKYKLSKEAARFLIEELTPYLETAPNGLSVDMQVLTTLKLLGSGSFQRIIAETIDCHQSSVSRYFENVIQAIVKVAKRFIHFPTSEAEVARTRQRFFEVLGFPNTLGAIDCTHIQIQRPNRDDWFNFMNRKGKFTINVQAICDADLKILDIVVRWPGSWHDSLIWSLSAARKMFESGRIRSNVFLLGDSGYPLEVWLMTPFSDPTSPSEEIYNTKHRSARNVVERCFGVMKSRFRIISQSGGTLCYDPKKAGMIVIAIAVLHNICVRFNLNLDDIINDSESDNDDDDDDSQRRPSRSREPLLAVVKRQEIANAFQAAR